MAGRLRELEETYQSILFVGSLTDWPWVRDAYMRQLSGPEVDPFFAPIQTFGVEAKTLIFLLGELPFLTGLYERGRRELTPDDNLSVDGIKEMVLAARDRLTEKLPKVAKRVTPQLLSVYFRYVRNLALMDRRLTPDLYSLVVAAQQTAGDDFALAIAETAREYPYADEDDDSEDTPIAMGVDRAEVPGWGLANMVSRLPGQMLSWRTCELRPKPPEKTKQIWKQKWNPYGMCSWPPEDDKIESFHRHVRDQARAILGSDLARSEKFTSSVMDGIDIRETLRNWHTGDLYVKVMPPSRGLGRRRRLPLRRPGRPRGLHQPRDLVRRALRGIDARLLRHRPDGQPHRPRHRPGRLRRGHVPVPAAARPRHLVRPAARLHRRPRRPPPRRRLPA